MANYGPKVERRKIFKSDRSIHEGVISLFPGPYISCRDTEPPTQPRAKMNLADVGFPLSSTLVWGDSSGTSGAARDNTFWAVPYFPFLSVENIKLQPKLIPSEQSTLKLAQEKKNPSVLTRAPGFLRTHTSSFLLPLCNFEEEEWNEQEALGDI